MKINGIDYGENWIWPDEFDWSPITQTTEPTFTGGLVVEEFIQQAGRPITLQGNWLTRAQITTLKTLMETGGSVSIDYRGNTITAYWRHSDKPLEAREIFDSANPDAAAQYDCTLRFIEG